MAFCCENGWSFINYLLGRELLAKKAFAQIPTTMFVEHEDLALELSIELLDGAVHISGLVVLGTCFGN